MTGPSVWPDPATHAYRSDIADVALAGKVIASHYAEPLMRAALVESSVAAGPEMFGDPLFRLKVGEGFAVLECGHGLAWGYIEASGLVGYVDETALG